MDQTAPFIYLQGFKLVSWMFFAILLTVSAANASMLALYCLKCLWCQNQPVWMSLAVSSSLSKQFIRRLSLCNGNWIFIQNLAHTLATLICCLKAENLKQSCIAVKFVVKRFDHSFSEFDPIHEYFEFDLCDTNEQTTSWSNQYQFCSTVSFDFSAKIHPC